RDLTTTDLKQAFNVYGSTRRSVVVKIAYTPLTHQAHFYGGYSGCKN
ncbi:MAG: hypothetical protein RLZZ181_251, partial [Pseudomonadota bacterium]